MANTKLQFKRTTVSGRLPNTTISANTSYIDAGEFAINLTDGKVVSSNGTVTFEVGANLSSLNVATSIAVGGATINSTIYSATANNANNLGGTSLATLQTQITGNAATAYSNGVTYSTNASNLGNGTVAPARLGSGAANSTTVLYGNSVFAELPATTGSIALSQQFTANGTANSFTISGGYTANQVAVFVNGVKQIPVTDVDITSGSTINLASTPLNGYSVDVFGYNTVIPGSLTTANTATYLSNSSGTLLNIQNYITGNAATAYSNAVSNAAALYQTTAGLSANVLLLTAGQLGNSSGTLLNIQNYITGNAATAYTNATSYVTSGGYTVSGIVNYSGNVILTSGNDTNQLLISTINATSTGLLANSTVLTVGNTTVNTTISAAATALFTPTIRGSRETVLANTTAAGAMILDLSYGIHRWTVTGNITSINYTNVPANNVVFNGTLYVTASATSTNATNRAITFPSVANATTGKTLFPGAVAPPQTSSNGSLDIYSFATIDGGNNYVWSLAVKDAR